MNERRRRVIRVLLLAVVIAVVSDLLLFVPLRYTRIMFTDNEDSSFGLRKRGFWPASLLSDRIPLERYNGAQKANSTEAETTSTTQTKERANKTFYIGGGRSHTGGSSISEGTASSANPETWDERLQYMVERYNGSERVECANQTVFNFKITNPSKVWEAQLMINENNTITVNDQLNASVWVEITGKAAEDMFEGYLENQSKRILYTKSLEHWIRGDLSVYPFLEAQKLLACFL